MEEFPEEKLVKRERSSARVEEREAYSHLPGKKTRKGKGKDQRSRASKIEGARCFERRKGETFKVRKKRGKKEES